MTYQKPNITEEEFSSIQAILLNEHSTELARIIHDLDYGAFEVNDAFTDREHVEAMAENAVAMGLMTKRVIMNYPHAIYQLAPHQAKIA